MMLLRRVADTRSQKDTENSWLLPTPPPTVAPGHGPMAQLQSSPTARVGGVAGVNPSTSQ